MLAQKQHRSTQEESTGLAMSRQTEFAGSHMHPVIKLQRTIGNHAVQRLLHAKAEGAKAGLGAASAYFALDARHNLESRVQSARGGGQPLPRSERDIFVPRLGYGLRHDKIHTDANATPLNRETKARVITTSQDKLSQKREGSFRISEGRKFLAHGMTRTDLQMDVSQIPLQRKPASAAVRADPDLLARRIHAAFNNPGFLGLGGTDEKEVLDVLKTAYEQRLMSELKVLYSTEYPDEPGLEEELRDELSGEDLKTALRLYREGLAMPWSAGPTAKPKSSSAAEPKAVTPTPANVGENDQTQAPAEDSTTVPEITSKATVSAPDGMPNTRTTIGVCETIEFTLKGQTVDWSSDKGWPGTRKGLETFKWAAPENPGTATITATIPSTGETRTLNINVIAPNRVSFLRASALNYSPNMAGGRRGTSICKLVDIAIYC